MARDLTRLGDGERALGALLFAFATLALAGASVGLAIPLAFLRGDRLQALLGLNYVPPWGGRTVLLAWAALGAIAACAPAAVALARGRAALSDLSRAAAIAAPLILTSLVPQLRAVHFWVDRPLRFLVLLAIAVVAFERLLAPALRALPPDWTARVAAIVARASAVRRERLALANVVVAALAYAIFAARCTLHRHWRFESAGFDLGLPDTLMWNALHGDFFRSAVVLPEWTSFLAHHADFLSVLFLPIYALRPGAEWLLVLQALAVALAAVPLYGFARTLVPRGTALLLALLYLLSALVHGAGSYDFHWLPFSIGLLFALFWALAAERPVAAAVFFLLAILVREDVSIGLAGLGAFLVATGTRPRFGIVAAIVATLWFAVLKLGIMQSVGGAQFSHHYVGLIPPGAHGFLGVIGTALLNPAYLLGTLLEEKKLVYALHLFAPLAFVPLRRPAFLLLLVPGFVVTLMTTKHDPTISISFQYVSHWIPYLFGACVLFLHVTREPAARRAAAIAIAAGVVAHSVPFGAILQHETFVAGFSQMSFGFSDEDRARLDRFRRVAAAIPPDASVAATENEVPHLSTRRMIHTLKWRLRDADFVLLNRERVDPKVAPRLMPALARDYRQVAEEGEFALYERTTKKRIARAASTRSASASASSTSATTPFRAATPITPPAVEAASAWPICSTSDHTVIVITNTIGTAVNQLRLPLRRSQTVRPRSVSAASS